MINTKILPIMLCVMGIFVIGLFLLMTSRDFPDSANAYTLPDGTQTKSGQVAYLPVVYKQATEEDILATLEAAKAEEANFSEEAEDQGKEDEDKDCKVSEKFPVGLRQWCKFITKAAKRNNLDPDLVAALIYQESNYPERCPDGPFTPSCTSKNGAVGMMQVMPGDGIALTIPCPNGPCFAGRPSTQALRDPKFNIDYGTDFLAAKIAKYGGDTREALKSYGPRDYGYDYADLVLSWYQQFKN
jgi:hypothetical protein